MAEHNILGKKGEEIARKYLESKGYTILDQNWKIGKLEIDIVAQIENNVILVEVKTRNSMSEDISELISHSKEKHLLDAANLYMEEQNEELECRIDLILVHTNTDTPEVIHIENAITQA
jgi:putative endonuclease